MNNLDVANPCEVSLIAIVGIEDRRTMGLRDRNNLAVDFDFLPFGTDTGTLIAILNRSPSHICQFYSRSRVKRRYLNRRKSPYLHHDFFGIGRRTKNFCKTWRRYDHLPVGIAYSIDKRLNTFLMMRDWAACVWVWTRGRIREKDKRQKRVIERDNH